MPGSRGIPYPAHVSPMFKRMIQFFLIPLARNAQHEFAPVYDFLTA